MIKSRMRVGASWNDALILNLSSRGMMLRADQSSNRGAYLEIRRGPHVIVARVVWSGSGRFVVQTQDPVPADSLIRDPDKAALPAKPGSPDIKERRATPRPAEVRHESNRQKARIVEFVAITLACGAAAFLIGSSVLEIVASPLGKAQAALAK